MRLLRPSGTSDVRLPAARDLGGGVRGGSGRGGGGTRGGRFSGGFRGGNCGGRTMSGDSLFGGIGGISEGIPGECARKFCLCVLSARAVLGCSCKWRQNIPCKPRRVKSSRNVPKHIPAAPKANSLLLSFRASARCHASMDWMTSTMSRVRVTLSPQTRSNSTTRRSSASELGMACACAILSNS